MKKRKKTSVPRVGKACDKWNKTIIFEVISHSRRLRDQMSLPIQPVVQLVAMRLKNKKGAGVPWHSVHSKTSSVRPQRPFSLETVLLTSSLQIIHALFCARPMLQMLFPIDHPSVLACVCCYTISFVSISCCLEGLPRLLQTVLKRSISQRARPSPISFA